ncbi:MAG: hypothetical protein GYB65_01415, partial [Chloroflexi bacterium]|nr:hypothetical protein [Chloroflexota bacterium]
DPDDLVCNGLDDADCELLLDATAQMDTVSSMTLPAWSIDARLDTEDGTLVFRAAGTGAAIVPVDVNPTNPFTGQVLVLDITEASIGDGVTEQIGSGQLIITDSMTYFFFDDQWYGGETAEGQPSAMNMPLLATGDLASLGYDFSGVTLTTRGADTEYMGQPVATFTTDVDFVALVSTALASPAFSSLLEGATAGSDGGTVSAEEVALLSLLLTPLLQGSDIGTEQWVGLDDGYIHAIVIDVTLNFDLSIFDPSTPPITGTFNFASEIGGFNEPVEYEVPTEYEPLENLDLFGLLTPSSALAQ